jgi:toxin ParE1/3/4
MKNFNIEITLPAEHDLKGIADYITNELRDSSAARNVISKIGEAIIDLELFPFRNAIVLDERLALKGIRLKIVESYIVFYVISEGNFIVTIVRIIYNRRDWIMHL